MWLDYKGKRHFLPTEMPEEPRIRGHETQVKSHFSVASAVNWGEADVGIGIEKIAKQIDGGCVCPKTRPPSFCIKSKLEEQTYY